jgi:N6-L-threonylcarbamoyladenine synthase
MRILSIETSCDETAVSIIEAEGNIHLPNFKILGNSLFSQIEIHKEYGGVFPMMAKREHAKNLPQMLKIALTQAGMLKDGSKHTQSKWDKIRLILNREDGLFEGLFSNFEHAKKPDVDVIAVTSGPGLAPALWVGISFAKALEELWGIPAIPVNHMEGHITSILIENSDKRPVEFPAMSLLISGGHTEIVYIKDWGQYEVIGKTLDDAVGEAFDKTARMLGLPYPGGPEVSGLAKKAREENLQKSAKFTRPMLNSNSLDFSFSGLKTAVLYYIRDLTQNGEIELSQENKKDISREFEDSVIDVLLSKTKSALDSYAVKTLIIAGGVIANKKISEEFSNLENQYKDLKVITPSKTLSTDNSLMIAAAAYINILINPDIVKNNEIIAKGNIKLGEKL